MRKIESTEFKVPDIPCGTGCGNEAIFTETTKGKYPQWQCGLQMSYSATRYHCGSETCSKETRRNVRIDLEAYIRRAKEVYPSLKRGIKERREEKIRKEKEKKEKEAMKKAEAQ